MARLSRRSFITAVAAGMLVRGAPACAAPPPYRFRHGNFDLTIVSDGHLVLPVSFLALDAPPAEREALLAAAGQTGAQFNSPTNVTLIGAGNELVLIDMGSGDRFMTTAGKLWENLQAAGIDKAQITKVIFTHGHPDHLWGALDEFDELLLPNASFYVAAAERDFWSGDDAMRGLPAERAGFVTGARRRYGAIKERTVLFRPGDELVPGIHAVATPGHTQGHVSLSLTGGDGLLVGGDALTHPLISFAHPHWRPAADHVPEQAAATRMRLLDQLATDRMRLIGFHLPYPGLGSVERANGAYRFVPAA